MHFVLFFQIKVATLPPSPPPPQIKTSQYEWGCLKKSCKKIRNREEKTKMEEEGGEEPGGWIAGCMDMEPRLLESDIR